MSPKAARLRPLFVTLGVSILYLILWLFLPKPSFWGLDNGIKYQGARAFALSGSVMVPYVALPYDPHGVCRTMIEPFGRFKGKEGLLPVFSASYMVLSGLFFLLFGAWGPCVVPLLSGWGTLLACWLLWKRLRPNKDPSLFLALVGLGTPLLFYSLTIWEHASAMALMTLGFAFIVPEVGRATKSRYDTFLSGLLISAAIAMRTEVCFFAILLIFFWGYVGRNRADWFRYVGGLALGIVALGLLNDWQAKTPIPMHIIANLQSRHLKTFQDAFADRLENIYVILGSGFNVTLLSLSLLIPLLAAVTGRWWRRSPYWWYLLAGGALLAWGFWFAASVSAQDRVAYTSVSGGLFWVAPVLGLSLLPFANQIKGVWGMIWAATYICIVIIAFASPTVVGIHWGPRFIVAYLPLLMVLAVVRFERWWKRYTYTRPLLILLAVISVVNQLYSYELLLEARKRNISVNSWVAASGQIPTLTNSWWLPGDCALLSDRYPWFLTDSPGRLKQAVNSLKTNGASRFLMLEYPPYLDGRTWGEFGAAMLGQDSLMVGIKTLRKTVLHFKGAPPNASTTPMPVGNAGLSATSAAHSP